MTVFKIYDLDVIFPYESMYPEQKEYMGQLKLSFDANGPCILELPSGCGKNITVFSLVLAYLATHPNMGPLVYGVTSIASFERVIRDLQIVVEARQKVSDLDFDKNFVYVPFLSRELSCVNSAVLNKSNIPLSCAKLTFPWTETKCPYYSNTPDSLKSGCVQSIEDFKIFISEENHSCPFHSARRLCQQAQVVICSVEEIISPRAGASLRGKLPSNSIIVFEDSNSLDSICCNTMSFNISKPNIDAAQSAVKNARNFLARAKEREQEKLQASYKKLKAGLKIEEVDNFLNDSLDVFKHPVVKEHRSVRNIPGTLRNPDVLLGRIYNLIQYLQTIFEGVDETCQTSSQFLSDISEKIFVEPETLHFLTTAFTNFLIDLQITEIDTYVPLFAVLDLAAIVSTYEENITIFYDAKNPNSSLMNERNKVLQLACLDASLAFSQLSTVDIKRIVLTGETISPLNMYSQILNFEPTSMVDYTILTPRNNILPIVVARGTDQTLLTSATDLSKNLNATNNYGRLISDIVKIIPDGVIGFFPSYPFMYEIIEMWNKTGVLKSILDHKLIFIESQQPSKTALLIDNYKRAIDNGRGCVFFGVSTGASSNGIDFSGAYGRCCILFGLPEPQKINSIIKSRAEFLDKQFQISKEVFQIFNSIRIASSCFSKVLSSKSDYSIILLADPRYEKEDYITSLPAWVRKCITQNQINQSVDDAIDQAKGFYLKMTQPFKHNKESIVLNGFQSWCDMYDIRFNNKEELADFVRFTKTKEETMRLRIDESDYKDRNSLSDWINRNWNSLDQFLNKFHNEWALTKRREMELA
ncbi:DNA repair helicase UVH6 [Tritrichomonas foetus]|uniref:DNA 5'-3' helicase n=1 Tax=Tritrichomonas foetus TaxID=1144522 RepID=A0A1J4J5Z4_9EUKA|nr:DNA repair helicase UVH6 [Tritrichomonas foetus]|eukprot:OHS92877.1 DNA repair helicase UVH6 [Tritrichomonas foetus]